MPNCGVQATASSLRLTPSVLRETTFDGLGAMSGVRIQHARL